MKRWAIWKANGAGTVWVERTVSAVIAVRSVDPRGVCMASCRIGRLASMSFVVDLGYRGRTGAMLGRSCESWLPLFLQVFLPVLAQVIDACVNRIDRGANGTDATGRRLTTSPGARQAAHDCERSVPIWLELSVTSAKTSHCERTVGRCGGWGFYSQRQPAFC